MKYKKNAAKGIKKDNKIVTHSLVAGKTDDKRDY